MSEDAHHKYGPSALASYELCSHYEPEPADEKEEHAVTTQGSKCHKAIEDEDFSQLTPEEVLLAQWCIDKRNEFTEGAKEHYKEVRLDIGKKKDGSHLLFGTVDHVALDREMQVGVVADYKFGYHGVDAADTNIQGQAYILGTFENLLEIEKLVLVFLLTRRREITSHLYTREDIDGIRARIETIIERAEKKIGKPTPYPHNCLYCGNKAGCEAWIRIGLKLREKYMGEALKLDVDKLVEAHGSNTQPDPEQIEIGLLLADGLEDWAKAYKHHVKKLILDNGLTINGREIVTRRGNINMTGTSAEIFHAYAGNHISLDAMLRASVPDMGQLVKELKAVAPKGTKGKVEGELYATLTELGLMGRGESSHSLQRTKKKTE